MKKLTILILVTALLLTVSACGTPSGGDGGDSQGSTGTVSGLPGAGGTPEPSAPEDNTPPQSGDTGEPSAPEPPEDTGNAGDTAAPEPPETADPTGGEDGTGVPDGTDDTDGTGGTGDAGGADGGEMTVPELVELCLTYVDRPVSELIAVIGEPSGSEYASSCLNPGVGEDGELYYDGFTVYTYREGDSEVVVYAE